MKIVLTDYSNPNKGIIAGSPLEEWFDIRSFIDNRNTKVGGTKKGFLCTYKNFAYDPSGEHGFCTFGITMEAFTEESEYIKGDCPRFPCTMNTTFGSRKGSTAIIDPENGVIKVNTINKGNDRGWANIYNAITW